MNCAKCIKAARVAGTRYDIFVKPLLKIGESGDSEHFQCPNCRALFWFPKDTTAEQITFNRSLLPA